MSILLMAISAVAAPPSGQKQPEEAEEIDVRRGGDRTKDAKDWGFETSSGASLDVHDDDPGMLDFVAAKRRKPAEPTHSHLYPEGHRPLADDWDLHFVAYNELLVVVELPVLVASDRASFRADYPNGMQIVGDWVSGPHRLTIRQEVRPDDVLANGPTFVFLKAALPNPKPVDEVRVLVKSAALPDPSAEASVQAPALKDRYARTTVYSRR